MKQLSVSPLTPPAPDIGMYEPHVAIDPANPNRIAATAMYGVREGLAARSLYLWASEDAGASWHGTRMVQPRGDGEGTADPVVAFTTDGALLLTGMIIAKGYVDALESLSVSRYEMPDSAPLLERLRIASRNAGGLQIDKLYVSRSEDNGRSFTSTVITPSPGADKPAVAVDRHAGSPFSGNVYVSWQASSAGLGMVHVVRSDDGGRTFGAPVPVVGGPEWGPCMAQLAVLPDGSLHVVWALLVAPAAGAPPEAGGAIWHAVSRDGGRSFEPPVAIAGHAGLELIGIPALAVDSEGRMAVVWGQGSAIPDEPAGQVRHRLYVTRSDDGTSWTEPTLACPDIPATTSMGLPAIAGDCERWWILTYLADDTSTEVAVLVSDDGVRFRHAATLGRRPVGADDIFMHGRYSLRLAADVLHVGDYVGIAAVGQQVAAAFVLPETDDPHSTATAYVALLSSERD